jgi:hypothetical protein
VLLERPRSSEVPFLGDYGVSSFDDGTLAVSGTTVTPFLCSFLPPLRRQGRGDLAVAPEILHRVLQLYSALLEKHI